MEFVVYTYHFAPDIEERQLDLFESTFELRQQIMSTKREVFTKSLEEVHFKYRNKSHAHSVVFSKDDITVLRLANARTITFEKNFTKVKENTEPSCYIIIDNREDSQTIMVEKNGHAFPDEDTVIKILLKSFNNILKPQRLIMDIKKRPKEREFWDFCEKNKGKIAMIRFSYEYPNVGRASEEMRKILKESSAELRSARTTVTYESDDVLEISKDNEVLKGLADDSYQGGRSIDIRLKGSRKYHQTGHTSLTITIEPSLLVEKTIDKLKTIINAIIK